MRDKAIFESFGKNMSFRGDMQKTLNWISLVDLASIFKHREVVDSLSSLRKLAVTSFVVPII